MALVEPLRKSTLRVDCCVSQTGRGLQLDSVDNRYRKIRFARKMHSLVGQSEEKDIALPKVSPLDNNLTSAGLNG